MDRQIREKLLKKLTKARPSMEEDEVDEIFDEMIDLLKCSVPSENSSQEDKERRFREMCRILVKFRDEQLLLPAGNHIYDTLEDLISSEVVGRLQDGVDGAAANAQSATQTAQARAQLSTTYASRGYTGFGAPPPP